MKRRVVASELPAGYLKTNKFNSKINGNNNILQAIEIAIAQKFDQFDNFCQRQFYLTSDASWEGTVTYYENRGWYIQLVGTRSDFNAFVDEDGNVIRKPRNLDPNDITGQYSVSGNNGHVQFISTNKIK